MQDNVKWRQEKIAVAGKSDCETVVRSGRREAAVSFFDLNASTTRSSCNKGKKVCVPSFH